MPIQENANAANLACAVCDYWPTSRTGLEKHIRRAHITSERREQAGLTLRCPVPNCDYTSNRDGNWMTEHIKTNKHNSSEAGQFAALDNLATAALEDSVPKANQPNHRGFTLVEARQNLKAEVDAMIGERRYEDDE